MYRFRRTTANSYVRDYKRQRRLSADLPLVAEHYPELVKVVEPATGLESLEGLMPLVAERSGVTRHIPVRVAFPGAYPDDEPRAFDHTGRFLPHTSLRHFYSDGRCCLWLPWNSLWEGRRDDGLLDFLAHVAIFFNHQLLFDATGTWPVPARGHGPDGYREFLTEELGISPQDFPDFVPLLLDGSRVAYLPCPCLSGKQAKYCHLELVKKLISKVGRSELRRWVTEIVEAAETSAAAVTADSSTG